MTAMKEKGRVRPGVGKARATVALAGAVLALSGCDEPLVAAQDIDAWRVLGARLEVEGEPSRATPRPGERALVRWLVASPHAPSPAVAWSLSACESAPDAAGVSRCTGEPFGDGVRASPSAGEPTLAFTVPAGIGEGTRGLSVVGALCEGLLDPGIPADRADCEGGGEGTRVSFGFDVSEGGRDNGNPLLGPEALSIGGASWAVAAPPAGSCAGAGLVEIRADSARVDVELVLPADSAELISRSGAAGPARETLLVAHFATGGRLERVFSRPHDDGIALRVAVGWKPPASAPAGGRAVRLYFVVRDDRGGADFTERTVCVVP